MWSTSLCLLRKILNFIAIKSICLQMRATLTPLFPALYFLRKSHQNQFFFTVIKCEENFKNASLESIFRNNIKRNGADLFNACTERMDIKKFKWESFAYNHNYQLTFDVWCWKSFSLRWIHQNQPDSWHLSNFEQKWMRLNQLTQQEKVGKIWMACTLYTNIHAEKYWLRQGKK